MAYAQMSRNCLDIIQPPCVAEPLPPDCTSCPAECLAPGSIRSDSDFDSAAANNASAVAADNTTALLPSVAAESAEDRASREQVGPSEGTIVQL